MFYSNISTICLNNDYISRAAYMPTEGKLITDIQRAWNGLLGSEKTFEVSLKYYGGGGLNMTNSLFKTSYISNYDVNLYLLSENL